MRSVVFLYVWIMNGSFWKVNKTHSVWLDQSGTCYAVVTPLRKAASYEPRIAILGI